MTETILEKIYRFPVKGFPGETLKSAAVEAGRGIPNDRRFAITNGTEYNGEWMLARSYFINAYNDGMMKHKLSFDNGVITLQNTKGTELELRLDDPESLSQANEKIAGFMKPVGIQEDLPPPKIIERVQSDANWDYPDTPLSIINIETVKAIEEVIGARIDPSRFRGNLIISGLPAWQEFSMMGKKIKLGNVELQIHRPTDRCPTPGVSPETGERDIQVTPLLQQHFGHNYCGMYAQVLVGGEIKPGDKLTVLSDSTMTHLDAQAPENANAYALWPRMTEVTTCEIGETVTRLSIKSATPWPLADANPGQRIRFHLAGKQWTTEYIAAVSPDHYHFEVENSQTSDPVTEIMRNGLTTGQRIVVSGPFGRS